MNATGTIHDLGYKRYVGARLAASTRWIVVMKNQIAYAWKTWWRYKSALGLAVIVTVWTGAVVAGAAGVVIAIPAAGFLSVSMRHWREYREIERLVATVK